jgi:hypothetical protein
MDISALFRTVYDILDKNLLTVLSTGVAVKTIGVPLQAKIGETIGQLYDIALGHRMALWSERRKNILVQNTITVVRELQHSDPMKINQIHPDFAIPIIEKLSYVEAPEIAKLFASLLAKSVHGDHVQNAHPRYINIINNLSIDDARIIKYLYEDSQRVFAYPIPYIRVYGENKTNPNNRLEYSERLTAIQKNVDLIYPEADVLYIENLVSQEILQIIDKPLVESHFYEEALNLYADYITEVKTTIQDDYEIKIEYGEYRLTYWGKAFINACFMQISDTSQRNT